MQKIFNKKETPKGFQPKIKTVIKCDSLRLNFVITEGGYMKSLVPDERIEKSILMIRGQKVLLDSTLADLYDETIKRLNQQVRRNMQRFPPDFMFQLTKEEYQSLRLHFATLETGRGQHRKYLPLVFTEQGVAMLSSVLTSDRAVEVNIQIMRAFVRLRQILASNKELARRLDELEMRYDHQFKQVFDAIRKLMEPPVTRSRQIGFRTN